MVWKKAVRGVIRYLAPRSEDICAVRARDWEDRVRKSGFHENWKNPGHRSNQPAVGKTWTQDEYQIAKRPFAKATKSRTLCVFEEQDRVSSTFEAGTVMERERAIRLEPAERLLSKKKKGT